MGLRSGSSDARSLNIINTHIYIYTAQPLCKFILGASGKGFCLCGSVFDHLVTNNELAIWKGKPLCSLLWPCFENISPLPSSTLSKTVCKLMRLLRPSAKSSESKSCKAWTHPSAFRNWRLVGLGANQMKAFIGITRVLLSLHATHFEL